MHSQFERPNEFGEARFEGGKAELERSQDFARRAWNSAIYACAMFEDDERAIREFNEAVEVEAKKEEEEVDEFNEKLA